MTGKKVPPYRELQFSFTNSRGPGGQHVNRTHSAVTLRWTPSDSEFFSEHEKHLLLAKLPLTVQGEILIRSENHRSQDQNKSECLRKLEQFIVKALTKPKKRVKTKPTNASRLNRLFEKTHRREIKSTRKKVIPDYTRSPCSLKKFL